MPSPTLYDSANCSSGEGHLFSLVTQLVQSCCTHCSIANSVSIFHRNLISVQPAAESIKLQSQI